MFSTKKLYSTKNALINEKYSKQKLDHYQACVKKLTKNKFYVIAWPKNLFSKNFLILNFKIINNENKLIILKQIINACSA